MGGRVNMEIGEKWPYLHLQESRIHTKANNFLVKKILVVNKLNKTHKNEASQGGRVFRDNIIFGFLVKFCRNRD